MVKFVLIQGIFFVYVPNAFTPDGDGVNDLFGAQGQGIDNAEFQLTVFARWGKPVYLTTDRDKPWDGPYGGNGGEPAMQGMYRLEAGGGRCLQGIPEGIPRACDACALIGGRITILRTC